MVGAILSLAAKTTLPPAVEVVFAIEDYSRDGEPVGPFHVLRQGEDRSEATQVAILRFAPWVSRTYAQRVADRLAVPLRQAA